MKALKALKEHRARRGSDEEEEETEGTIRKPEIGKGQQKVWSLRDSGDDFAMFSFKIGTSDGPKTGRRSFSFEAGRRQSRDLFSEIFAALARFFSNKKSLSLVLIKNNQSKPTNERTKHFFPLFLFSSNQRIKNSAVFENLRARLDGVPVRALRGDSQKARFEDVFVLGDPVRGLSKSTHEPREREREPRVFLPEGGKLSVRARHFRELVTSESVSHAVV